MIPFLGIFLTTVALSQEAEGLTEAASSRERLDSQRKRKNSLYENYVILEAVTVRKRLEKLRSMKSSDGEFVSRFIRTNPYFYVRGVI